MGDAATRRGREDPGPWRWYLALGLAAIGAYLLLPDGAARGGCYLGVGLSAIGAKIAGVRCYRPVPVLPWLLIIAGGLALSVGSVLESLAASPTPTTPPLAVAAQVADLASYLLLGGGLVLLVRRHTWGADRAGLLDALLVTASAGLVGWLVLVPADALPRHADQALPLAALAYPLLDLLLLAVAAQLALSPTARTPAAALLGLGLALGLLADTASAALQLVGVGRHGAALDAVWLLSYVLWGTAALHPSMRALTAAASPRAGPPRLTRRRVALLAGALLTGPAARAVQAGRGRALDIPALVGGSVVLWGLALARLGGLVDLLTAALARVERAAARERALRRAAAVLLAATDRGAVEAAAVEAALALAGSGAGTRACLARRDGARLVVVAAAGRPDGVPLDAAPAPRALPSAVDAALRDRRLVTLAPPAATAVWGALGAGTVGGSVILAPLPRGEGYGEVLLAGGPALDTVAFADGLAVLAAQVALALDRADLAEALHARRSEDRFRALVQHASDVIAVVAADGTIGYASPAIARVLGYRAEERQAANAFDLLHPDDRDKGLALRAAALAGPASSAPVEVRVRHRDGTWRHLEIIATDLRDHPDVGGIVLNSRDVTERRALEERLRYQAHHDPLTGLANRARFLEGVAAALARGRAAVLFLDLDRFKVVNDSLGHAVGDRLLVATAARLRDCTVPGDLLARLGGDEFTVLLAPGSGLDAARRRAKRVLAALAVPFPIDGHAVVVTTSVGVAFGEAGGRAAELLRDADVAMYQAKQAGKARYAVYDGSMRAAAVMRLALESDLRQALERDELRVYYQPKVALATGRIAGVEALVRWQHPTRGLLAPGTFIPLAEETGLILPLGRWVLAAACAQLVAWRERYPASGLLLGVNVSARQLQRGDLAAEVAAILAASGLAPGALKLELTESVLMEDAVATGRAIRDLRGLGVQLILDDFGTGYSSLAYLKRLPLDALKIDRSFVAGLGTDPEDAAIVRAVVSLARALDLLVVAEGVETAEHAAALRALGCDLGQGMHFAAPLPPDELATLLAREAAGAHPVSDTTARGWSAGSTP